MGSILLKAMALGFFGFVALSVIAQRTLIQMKTLVKAFLILVAFIVLMILGSSFGAFK